MPDYQKMYFTLFKATENAIKLLISAQRTCEEMYIAAKEPELTILSNQEDMKKGIVEE